MNQRWSRKMDLNMWVWVENEEKPEVFKQMIKQIEDAITGLLKEYDHSGLGEEQLFNYVIRRVGTVEKPLLLDDYKTARINLSEKIVEREITIKLGYGDERKEMRLFLKECGGYSVVL